MQIYCKRSRKGVMERGNAHVSRGSTSDASPGPVMRLSGTCLCPRTETVIVKSGSEIHLSLSSVSSTALRNDAIGTPSASVVSVLFSCMCQSCTLEMQPLIAVITLNPFVTASP